MCNLCGDPGVVHEPTGGRRRFLKLAGAAAVSLALAPRARAKDVKPPAKPQNVISADESLKRLMQGNGRYVEGVAQRHDFKAEREALSKGQNPYAGILSCADSRVAPEYAFDAGRGDLFVVRVAGNFATDDGIASFEYAVQVLGTPLLMVLGHQGCGAISAAVKSIRDKEPLPGHLPSLVTSLAPAVNAVLDQPGDVVANATKQNVLLTVRKLTSATPILSRFVEEQKIRVVGAVYNLATGRVDLVA
jgi:carbonic anhydrase